ncbi:MAG TPA: ATP-binding protein [Microlunatus sp.]|nr:ATP-binding protein [Microlunatus sp.]
MVGEGSAVQVPVRSSSTVAAPVPVRRLLGLATFWAVAIVWVTALLAGSDPASPGSQLIGSVAILAAILFCLVSCILVVRRRTPARLSWSLIAVGMGLGALGQLGYVVTALSATQTTPSTLGDTLAFLGYFLPTVAAIFAFPRRAELLISRFRQILDALVITIGVLLISEATVLGAVLELTDTSTLAGWLHLAYLVADIAICALVLCIGMRQLPGDRLTWFFLGSGLLVVAVSDSIYVRLLADGATYLTATPLAAGWMLGPVLIGLATLVPMTGRLSHGRDYTVLLQLLPYVPVIGSLVVLGLGAGVNDPSLLITGALLLVVLMIRQVMIVYENVSLTRDLEGKVATRTAELTTLGSIVTSSSDAIVGVSRDNRITAWNPAAEKLFEHLTADVVGRSPDVLREGAAVETSVLLDRAARGESLDTYEVDWLRADGRHVPVAMTVSPILDADGVQGISIFAQDITERRHAAETLEQARQDALASSQLKSEFLATMSHEIRTPMNAVIGLTSLLLETELDDTQRMYAEGVQSAGGALLTVIDDILDFSKLEAGKVILDHSDFSPRQLVEEVGTLIAPAAGTKGLELIAYGLPDLPAAVNGDAGRVRQILLNLASNAVKFTPQGEVIIKVGAVATDRDRARLRFEVIDTGIGIAEKDQGRLFESFSQADASTTRRFGGTGLGLAISRRLVEVMGGTIGLESEVNIGSTFWFEVTLRAAGRAGPSVEELSRDLLADLRALIVDDNATNRTLLEAQLAGWGMHTDAVDSAVGAFARLRTAALEGHPYDLVALDAHMPDEDGLGLAARVTADPVLAGQLMIMLTSGLPPEPEAMRETGISYWLPKPLRSVDLFDRLMRLMSHREAELRARRRIVQHPSPPAGDGGPVLVVDSHPVRRLVAKRLLSRLGYQVHDVTAGEEALEAVKATSYAAVLIDCSPGSSDGFENAQEIRRLDGDDLTPIVAMITYATADERERCLAAGMEHRVSRPLDSDVLQAALNETARSTLVHHHDRPVTSNPDRLDDDHDVIDASRLEDLDELSAGDGTSLLTSLIESYVHRAPSRVEALEQAINDGDLQEVTAVAHELKGASGTIGAPRVMTYAAEIEHRSRDGLTPSPDSLPRLRAELEAATRALADYVRAPHPR